MGETIINEYPNHLAKHTTNGMFLGLPDAEDEAPEKRGLESFYEDIHEIATRLEQETFIITGRKGCGKTAFVRFINKQSDPNGNIHSKIVLPKDYDLEKIVQNVNETLKNEYKIIYEWIILVCFAEMILSVNRFSSAEAIVKLEKFWRINSGHLSISNLALQGLEKGTNTSGDLNFLEKLKINIGKAIKGSFIKPNFTQLINDLRINVIKALNYQLHENQIFYLFFDDLDEKFNVENDDDCKRILDLVEVAKSFNTDFLSGSKGKVVIMLREDLIERMSGINNNYTKNLYGCSYSLKWLDPSHDNSNEKNLMLRKLLNRRIALNFDKLGIPYDHSDPWISFVENSPLEGYNYLSAFYFILGFTQCRPRDFLYIFNKIGDHNYQIPLDEESVKKLLNIYVDVAFSEVNDELVDVIGNRSEISNLLKICDEFVGLEDFSYRQLNNRLNNHQFTETDKYIKILIDYNIIIPIKDDIEKPHYLFPKLKGQLKDYRYKLSKWMRAHIDDSYI